MSQEVYFIGIAYQQKAILWTMDKDENKAICLYRFLGEQSPASDIHQVNEVLKNIKGVTIENNCAVIRNVTSLHPRYQAVQQLPVRKRHQSFTAEGLKKIFDPFHLFGNKALGTHPHNPAVVSEQRKHHPASPNQNHIPFTIEHLCFLMQGKTLCYRTLYQRHQEKSQKTLILSPNELHARQTTQQNLSTQKQLINDLTTLFNERLSLAYKKAGLNENDTTGLFTLYEDAIELLMNAKAHEKPSHGEQVSKHHYMKHNAEREFKAYVEGVLTPFACFGDESIDITSVSEDPKIQKHIELIRQTLSKDDQNACQCIVNEMKNTLVARQFKHTPFEGYTSLTQFIQIHYPSNCQTSDKDPAMYQKVTLALTKEALNHFQMHKAAAEMVEQALSKTELDVMICNEVVEHILPTIKQSSRETWATKCAQLIFEALHTLHTTENVPHEDEKTPTFSH